MCHNIFLAVNPKIFVVALLIFIRCKKEYLCLALLLLTFMFVCFFRLLEKCCYAELNKNDLNDARQMHNCINNSPSQERG